METEIQNSKWTILRQKLWILFPVIAVGVGAWLLYGVSTIVWLKKEIAVKDEKVSRLEESLGLRNELYANGKAEYSMIIEFGTIVNETILFKFKEVLPPTAEILKRIEKGEKPTLPTIEKTILGKIDKATLYPTKKLEEFKTGDLVKVISITPISGDQFLIARIEPYVDPSLSIPKTPVPNGLPKLPIPPKLPVKK